MIDPRLDPLLQTSLSRLLAELVLALDDCLSELGRLSTAADDADQRSAWASARQALQSHQRSVSSTLDDALRRRVQADLRHDPGEPAHTTLADWSDLRLMDDAEIEQTVTASRLTRRLEAGSELQLQELQSLFATLQGLPCEAESFPLRPALVGQAMASALESHMASGTDQNAVAHVWAERVAPRLATTFDSLLQACRQQGVKSTPLAMRKTSAGPTTASGGLGNAVRSHNPGQPDTRTGVEALSQLFGMAVPPGSDRPASAVKPDTQIEQDLQALMQRLQAVGFGGEPPTRGTAPSSLPHTDRLTNVIRAHRDELLSASGGGALDQMVIDIVGALFDQVLSDPKVPPAMAHQIARLQLPVLRVALRDPSFFHSRKHPVRRLINRMASIATSYDGLDDGPGRECVQTVTELVGSIVEGDFERVDLYESHLEALEAFVAGQNTREVQERQQATRILADREADLRVQQRFMQQVAQELANVEAPEFLKVFLAQIWTQVQVLLAGRHGPESPQALRAREVTRDLLLSVQPQGHPSLRMGFLQRLPALMRDLNEGLDLIAWASSAREAFLGHLLPLHSKALKTPPAHELGTRLLAQSLKRMDHLPIPTRQEAAHEALPHALTAPDSASDSDSSLNQASTAMATLSGADAALVGWMGEGEALQGALDIDLSDNLDPDLSRIHAELPLDCPPPPTDGMALMQHIRAGSTCQMVLAGHWKKVRLVWLSEGRSFFLFDHGPPRSRETISLTGRTLGKLCATGRFRALEQAELLERATLRARRQLAALTASA